MEIQRNRYGRAANQPPSTSDSNDLLSFSQPQRKVFSVTEITESIKTDLEDKYSDIWVEGEIGSFKLSGPGHAYFNLKDDNSLISAVIFAGSMRSIKCPIKDGLKVLAFGRVSVYPPRGNYQLIITRLEASGLGNLQQAFEALKAKLSAEGLFDESRKRPLPLLPRRIGIVTSKTGAALQDILKVLYRRFPNARVVIAHTQVQGSDAAPQIVQAIKNLHQTDEPIDVIIVARGGGSIEDLWPFNEEIVARAVSQSEIPIISGVGHEVDFTICDFVADLRAPTPSAAAELVVKRKEDMESEVLGFTEYLRRHMRQLVDNSRDRLNNISQRPVLSRPHQAIEPYLQRLDDLSGQLERGIGYFLERMKSQVSHSRLVLDKHSPTNQVKMAFQQQATLEQKLLRCYKHQIEILNEKLENKAGRLQALSPLSILGRGYSIVFTEQGEAIRDSASVKENDIIRVRLHKGQLKAKVMEKENPSNG